MNGKGDKNRSISQEYRDGWDRVFGEPDRFDRLAFTLDYNLEQAPLLDKIVKRSHEGLIETAASAVPDKPLTNDQQFAIAVLAGARFSSTYDDGKMVMTTEPCNVVHDGRQWVVTSMARPQGDNS